MNRKKAPRLVSLAEAVQAVVYLQIATGSNPSDKSRIPDESDRVNGVAVAKGPSAFFASSSDIGIDFGEGGRGGRLRLTADVLRVLFIGRMHPLKGLDVLLEAVEGLSRRDRSVASPVELTIIGLDEKGMRARFEAWCAAKGIATRVRFLGVVDEATKMAEIDRCDLFCLPTLSENFGIVVGEAMSRGKPVITTDGATSWSQLPADCGWYLDGYLKANHKRRVAMLTAALEEASGKNLAAMGSESSKWVRANFDWTTNVRRLMEAIEESKSRSVLAGEGSTRTARKRGEGPNRASRD